MTNEMHHHKNDPWLRVFCPEDACLTEEEHVVVSASMGSGAGGDSAWHEVFCPEDRCEAETPTQLA